MTTAIHTIHMGLDNIYVLKGKGTVIIDGGDPKKEKVFLKGLEDVSVRPEEVQLIILTHGHWDHIGSAKEIKDITGAKIAMHRREANWLEQSLKPLPSGVTPWGKVFIGIHKLFMPLISIPPVKVDVVLDDNVLSLTDYGIPGRILHTPGHSAGSVSVLLDTGEAFVGDLAMNRFPLRLSPGLPIFADDLDVVSSCLHSLFAHGARTIYPAHGKPFRAEAIQNTLSR